MYKAFDNVLHNVLIHDLFSIGVHGKVLQWFLHYLTDRQQQVRTGSSSSSPYLCSRGVPQGSVLGPLLFSLYIREVPSILRPHVDGCVLFADDVTFDRSSNDISMIGHSLSCALSALVPWLSQRGLTVNMTKTTCMLIQPRGTPSCDLLVTYRNTTLLQVDVVRFLGLMVDDRLQWDRHVDYLVAKVSRKVGGLRRSYRQLNIHSRRLYYLSIIQSDLLYGAPAYIHALSARNRARILSLANSGVRAIFGVPPWTASQPLRTYLHLSSILVCVDVRSLSLVYRFINHLLCPLFSSVLHLRTASSGRQTRGTTFNDLLIPSLKHSTPVFPSYVAPLWNCLPPSLRTLSSVHDFKLSCLKHLGCPVRRP